MAGWALFEHRKFRQAIRAFTAEFKAERWAATLCNRALAHLNLGNLNAALKDLQQAEALPTPFGRSDGYLQMIGMVLWLMKKESEAADVWLQLVKDFNAGKISYSDAAGGVETGHLLWFASCHPGLEELRVPANQFLTKRCRSKRASSWPGPIAKFLLGNLSQKALLTAARVERSDDSIPEENCRILESRQFCQVYFYLGARAIGTNNQRMIRKNMQKAVQHGSKSLIENEYYLAKRELERSGD